MLPDNSNLKLLSSNPSGLRALLDYLEAKRDQYDSEFTSMARRLVFSSDGRDVAVTTLGKKQALDELIRNVQAMTSINRGEK